MFIRDFVQFFVSKFENIQETVNKV